jgi:hypothetical protein
LATTPIGLFSGSLIGDVLVQARETVPDMPPAMQPPVLLSAAPATVGGGTLAGLYQVVMTAYNQWGESLPSAEFAVTVTGPNNAITLNFVHPAGNNGNVNVYFSLAGQSGTEDRFLTFVNQPDGPFNILSVMTASGGPPPTRSTAWLPDLDGGFISAGAIYRWLNAGLELIARGTGGFQDYSAIGSTINQPLYQIPANWNSITSIWYDGYWMSGGNPGYFFRRNSITSQVLSSAHISANYGRTILEVYPQPARTSVNTTLAADMAVTDTVCTLANAAFTLPFGFVSVGSEIMAYATINGNQLTGLIRGLGGTGAIAHTAGETAIECNIAWMGKRQSSQKYSPGQSTSVLPISSGWDQLLVQYIAGRAKIVEHDMQSMSAFNQDMEKQIKSWAQTNRGVVRNRQIGGNASPAAYYGDQAGGLIIP